MRIPQLALALTALTATTAFSVLGSSPALASATPETQAAAASTALSGLPVPDVVGSACGLFPSVIGLALCDENAEADPWE